MLERVGLARGMVASLPARVQRRAVSAHRHRARDDAAPEAADLRRTGEFSRRVHPGTDRQSAARFAARIRHGDAVHQPQSGGRQASRAIAFSSFTWADSSRSRRATRCSPRPVHPYTRALLAAVPDPTRSQTRVPPARRRPRRSPARNRGRRRVRGRRAPAGCAFRSRCAYAAAALRPAVPPLEQVAAGACRCLPPARELVYS